MLHRSRFIYYKHTIMAHKSKNFEKVAKKQRGEFKKVHEKTEYQRERDGFHKKRKHQRDVA